MKTKIVSRYDSEKVIYESEKETIREAVTEAVSKKTDLGGAYLRGADLRGAYLGGAYLRGADLGGAYLGGADLRDADLGDAYLRGADLRGAYLRGAYLGGADLRGAYLRGADLYEVKFYGRGGNTRITKSQVESFHAALGIVVEEDEKAT